MPNLQHTCPVCLTTAPPIQTRDYGEKLNIKCPRCGDYEISATALAMLDSRLQKDKLTRARLSHAIRVEAASADRLLIVSTNIDELSTRPLPKIEQQIQNLLNWLASELKDNQFGETHIESTGNLAGLIGAVDASGVQKLIDYAAQQKLITSKIEWVKDGSAIEQLLESTTTKTVLELTPEGWSRIDSNKDMRVKNLEQEPVATTPKSERADEIIKSHCNQCGPDRNAYVRANYTVSGNDDETSWYDTYQILECCGCNQLSVRHEHWFSEWDDFDFHPITGQPRRQPGIKLTFWPPVTTRKKPTWNDAIEDEELRRIFDEVYQALNGGLIMLASIGTRTLLDRAMYLRVGDPPGGFTGKLNKMMEIGSIGADERTTLEIMTDAGSASAHRGFAPRPQTLDTIVNTVENFLHREFVLKNAAGEVRKLTPPRKKQPGKE